MGKSVAPWFGQQGYTSSAFYGDEQAPRNLHPGAGGRPAVTGGPMLPRNPYAEFAWERQRLLGAMSQPNLEFPEVHHQSLSEASAGRNALRDNCNSPRLTFFPHHSRV